MLSALLTSGVNMEDDMHPLTALAYTTVTKILTQGEAKGHGRDTWKVEPKEMHGQKAVRHSITAQGIEGNPEFFPDKESAIQHAEQALVRQAMYLWHLIDEHKRSECGRGGK